MEVRSCRWGKYWTPQWFGHGRPYTWSFPAARRWNGHPISTYMKTSKQNTEWRSWCGPYYWGPHNGLETFLSGSRVDGILGSTFHDGLWCLFGDSLQTMLWELYLSGDRMDDLLLTIPYMMYLAVSLVVCSKGSDWVSGWSRSLRWQG